MVIGKMQHQPPIAVGRQNANGSQNAKIVLAKKVFVEGHLSLGCPIREDVIIGRIAFLEHQRGHFFARVAQVPTAFNIFPKGHFQLAGA